MGREILVEMYSTGEITRSDFDEKSAIINKALEELAQKGADEYKEMEAIKKDILTIELKIEELSAKPKAPSEKAAPPKQEKSQAKWKGVVKVDDDEEEDFLDDVAVKIEGKTISEMSLFDLEELDE